MDGDLTRHGEERLLRWLILIVGVHSCVLGAAMLLAPGYVLSMLGYAPAGPLFFPSQSGIFLVILGVCYLRALVEPSFVWTIVVSKGLAIAFLLTHLVFLSAPPIIWAAAAIDGAFFVATVILVRRQN